MKTILRKPLKCIYEICSRVKLYKVDLPSLLSLNIENLQVKETKTNVCRPSIIKQSAHSPTNL